MALIQANRMKTVLGDTDLELEADSGESFVIKDIKIYNPASAHLTCFIDEFTCGYFRTSGELGSHIPLLPGEVRHAHDLETGATAAGDQTSFASLQDADGSEIVAKSIGGLAASTKYPRGMNFNERVIPGYTGIIKLLMDKGLFEGYPIPEGSKFSLSGAKQAGSVQIVIYDKYEAGDIVADQPNGKNSNQLSFINYGNTGATIAAAGYNKYDTQVNPAYMVDFPFGSDVPGNMQIIVHALMASDFAPTENDATDGIGTKYLRMTRNNEVMFDEDKNGFLLYAKDYGDALIGDYVARGNSVIGNYSDEDCKVPLFFEPALIFTPGEELTLELNTVIEGAGQDMLIAHQELGVFMTVLRG